MAFNPNEHQHIRYNPLRAEWVLVSPHRALRPWGGQLEAPPAEKVPRHDPTNPLCPGSTRASGKITPDYISTYVFTNDFPALLEEGPEPPPEDDEGDLFRTRAAKGTCRVICYHPYSDVYFTDLNEKEVVDVIDEWIRQFVDLGSRYRWVQIFENRGQMMGCSNPHPHGQVWASSFLPNEPRVKDENLRAYYERRGRPLLADYLAAELTRRVRVVYENEHWVVLVPYWAVWPFETMVLPRRQFERFDAILQEEKATLARALRALVAKYDNLFRCAFPYSMGWHGAPTGPGCARTAAQPHWTFHGMYYPPLLRSATVKKFMVGYEMLAQAQRDVTPERAAEMLRAQPEEKLA